MSAARPPRSLWPREHGAYAQLGAPLVGAFAAGRLTVAAILLGVGACLAFLAHESLLVALGHRGRRMLEASGRRARGLAAIGTASALGAGVLGLTLAPPATLAVAGAVAIPTIGLLLLAWRRAERTILGEIIAATALAGAAAPVAIAAGVSVGDALLVWLAWSVGFAATVVAVHLVLARHRRPRRARDLVTVAVLATIVVVSLGLLAAAPPLVVAAPLAMTATVVALRPPRASRLRAIGVALLIASLASSTLVWWSAATG